MKYYSYYNIKRIDKTKTKSSQHDDDCLWSDYQFEKNISHDLKVEYWQNYLP